MVIGLIAGGSSYTTALLVGGAVSLLTVPLAFARPKLR
jgi:hypothetical protein